MSEINCPAAVFVAPEESRGRPGRLQPGPDCLKILLEDGRVFQLPWQNARFSLGGVDGHHLIIEGETHENAPAHLQTDYLSFCRLEDRIPPDIFRSWILPLRTTARRRRTLALAFGWLLGGVILLFLLFLYVSWGTILDIAIRRIPVSWEIGLGEASATQFLARSNPIKQGEDFDALQALFQRLVRACPDEGFTFQLHLVEEKEANAFALPGGTVIVHSGLLEQAVTAEEIAGVLAHEIQHIRHRHGMRRIVGNLGLGSLASIFIGDMQGLFGLAREAALHLSARAYDRDQEREADEGAVRLLLAEGIDPQPFAAFFLRLEEREGKTTKVAEYFSTHPPSRERMENVRKRTIELAGDTQFLPLPLHFSGMSTPAKD